MDVIEYADPLRRSTSTAGTTVAGVNRVFSLVAVVIAVVGLGYRLFRFISEYGVNVLYYDQWDFLTPLFDGRGSLLTLFSWQHGPHREGLGLVLDAFLYPATNWNTRAV